LYIFYPIFEDNFFVFKEVFQNFFLCMVSIQERFLIKSGLWWLSSVLKTLHLLNFIIFSMGYIYFQVSMIYFWQIFHALRLFKAQSLFFLPNFLGPMFISCPTSILDSREASLLFPTLWYNFSSQKDYLEWISFYLRWYLVKPDMLVPQRLTMDFLFLPCIWCQLNQLSSSAIICTSGLPIWKIITLYLRRKLLKKFQIVVFHFFLLYCYNFFKNCQTKSMSKIAHYLRKRNVFYENNCRKQ
jgi:hypothetical protein